MPPLPSLRLHNAQQCTATAKSTGERCQNPIKAPPGKVCRLHGWRDPATIKRGPQHPCFKSGEYSIAKHDAAVRLAELEVAARAIGLVTGKKSPGRKAG